MTASELGEWCADRLWELALEDEEAAKLERKTERDFASDALSKTALELEINMIKEAKDVLNESANLIPEVSLTMKPPALSAKVVRLKEFLDAEYENPTETRSIIFVQRRSTARLLADLFKRMHFPNMRVGTLIGTRQAESGDIKVTIREQMLTLMKFRQGDFNVLFATSIAEEGLDIPLCNVIVRFDLYTTMIQYIQSRGRARHKQSKYIHMTEAGNMQHAWVVSDAKNGELKLRAFCQNQPEDRLLIGNETDFDEKLLKERMYQFYQEPSTGAKLTFGTVLEQLSNFAECLAQNEESLSRPLYIMSYQGKRYICEVLLPASSPIRSVIGRPYSKKSVAKRSAAFEACLLLRRDGHLDENLIPIYHKQLPAMRNAHLALNVKKTNAYDMQVKPKFWEQSWGTVPSELSMVLVKVGEPAFGFGDRVLAPLVLLTRESLPGIPTFPVYLQPGISSDVQVIPVISRLHVDEKSLKLLTSFTLQCFRDPFNKAYNHDEKQLSYWLAPVCDDYDLTDHVTKILDWEAMKYVQANGQMRWYRGTPRSGIENHFMIDPHGGALRYFSALIQEDMDALDPPPEGVATSNHKHWDSILSYTSSLWKNSRDWIETLEKHQPVMHAYQIPHRRNWLDDFQADDVNVKTATYICPEPLNISPVNLDVLDQVFPRS